MVLNNTGSLLVTVTSGQVTVSRGFCKFRDLVTFREERGLHIQNASLCLSYSDQSGMKRLFTTQNFVVGKNFATAVF